MFNINNQCTLKLICETPLKCTTCGLPPTRDTVTVHHLRPTSDTVTLDDFCTSFAIWVHIPRYHTINAFVTLLTSTWSDQLSDVDEMSFSRLRREQDISGTRLRQGTTFRLRRDQDITGTRLRQGKTFRLWDWGNKQTSAISSIWDRGEARLSDFETNVRETANNSKIELEAYNTRPTRSCILPGSTSFNKCFKVTSMLSISWFSLVHKNPIY